MSRIKKLFIVLFLPFFFLGCTSTEQVEKSASFPKIGQIDKNEISIAVFSFKNYTDTPQAGERAANLLEGILSAKGYHTLNLVDEKQRSIAQQRSLARAKGFRYILIGGVSEWRYKTGIDGEPAISLQLKLLDVSRNVVVWSAAGSDNNWGNASIGTTAQGLFQNLLK